MGTDRDNTLFLDIKSAVPSVVLSWLIHDMRCRGVPAQYTDWIRWKVEGRCTTLKFDGVTSEQLTLPRGIDQGCPLSGILFQLYNSDLVNVQDPNNAEEVVAFMDNTLMLVSRQSLTIMNTKVKDMMVRSDGRLE